LATRFLTSIRLRWSHLYPYGQLETDVTSNKWKPLFEPAILPLTCPTSWDAENSDRLYQGYERNFYAVRVPDFMLSPQGFRRHDESRSDHHGGRIHDWLRIMNELCYQRLQRSYQIQILGMDSRTASNRAHTTAITSTHAKPTEQIPTTLKKETPHTPGGSVKPVLSFRERKRLREKVCCVNQFLYYACHHIPICCCRPQPTK